MSSATVESSLHHELIIRSSLEAGGEFDWTNAFERGNERLVVQTSGRNIATPSEAESQNLSPTLIPASDSDLSWDLFDLSIPLHPFEAVDFVSTSLRFSDQKLTVGVVRRHFNSSILLGHRVAKFPPLPGFIILLPRSNMGWWLCWFGLSGRDAITTDALPSRISLSRAGRSLGIASFYTLSDIRRLSHRVSIREPM